MPLWSVMIGAVFLLETVVKQKKVTEKAKIFAKYFGNSKIYGNFAPTNSYY